MSGPTAEERAAWTQQERERRLADLKAEPDAAAPVRQGLPSLREAQLAAEGAVSLVWKELAAEGPVGMFQKWSRRGMDVLVRAGREWEQESTQPGRGRRVPWDDTAP